MTELTFYAERSSVLHRRNPLTKLVAALSLLVAGFLLPWMWAAFALFACVIAPLAVIGKVGRPFFKSMLLLYPPFAFFLFLIHGFFHPASDQELLHIWIFSVQPSALAYATMVAGRVLLMLAVFTLLFLTTHPGRLTRELQRRGMHWSVAYIVTSTLQILPLIRDRARTILQAQQARGLDVGGSFLGRIRALVPLFGPLFYGVVLDVEDRALALEARAVTRKGGREFLDELPDPPAERVFRLCCLVGVLALAMWRGARAWPW